MKSFGGSKDVWLQVSRNSCEMWHCGVVPKGKGMLMSPQVSLQLGLAIGKFKLLCEERTSICEDHNVKIIIPKIDECMLLSFSNITIYC